MLLQTATEKLMIERERNLMWHVQEEDRGSPPLKPALVASKDKRACQHGSLAISMFSLTVQQWHAS
jgi:hypothetical protein